MLISEIVTLLLKQQQIAGDVPVKFGNEEITTSSIHYTYDEVVINLKPVTNKFPGPVIPFIGK